MGRRGCLDRFLSRIQLPSETQTNGTITPPREATVSDQEYAGPFRGLVAHGAPGAAPRGAVQEIVPTLVIEESICSLIINDNHQRRPGSSPSAGPRHHRGTRPCRGDPASESEIGRTILFFVRPSIRAITRGTGPASIRDCFGENHSARRARPRSRAELRCTHIADV